ncbi:hypothetical protein FN846DRAFT_907521 [Sphaerosporella brunnea]|uniref:Uncharacterized protein n=1 Tax=Sphaerosporella brunnea TaxID=1250544 RepID=A0A5J5EV84_9PEZI|nr:hypothetical protein FN846DRAFT_907521 [Sphaerosporella brunnea]
MDPGNIPYWQLPNGEMYPLQDPQQGLQYFDYDQWLRQQQQPVPGAAPPQHLLPYAPQPAPPAPVDQQLVRYAPPAPPAPVDQQLVRYAPNAPPAPVDQQLVRYAPPAPPAPVDQQVMRYAPPAPGRAPLPVAQPVQYGFPRAPAPGPRPAGQPVLYDYPPVYHRPPVVPIEAPQVAGYAPFEMTRDGEWRQVDEEEERRRLWAEHYGWQR